MIQQTAKVTRILDDQRAEVEVRRKPACGHDCAECSGGCSELMVIPTVSVIAENAVHAVPGDTVQVETSTQTVLSAAVIVYLVPFILFFAGYLICAAAGLSTTAAALTASAAFVVGLILAIMHDRKMKKKKAISFRITAIVPAD